MEKKQFIRMEVKEISDTGSFEGLLSPYGNVDNGGDVVERGAFTKTMQEHGNTIPLLWQHKPDAPIGQLSLEDRPTGLWCKGQLLMELPEAQKAHLLLKKGIVKGLSIGFKAIKDAVEEGARHLKELRLYEGSVVTFPMNELALVTSVKSERKDDFNEELAEIQLMMAGDQMRWALFDALSSVVRDQSMSRDEKITASETVIQQFSAAYMAYLPMYLDAMAEESGMGMMGNGKLETKAGRRISNASREAVQGACSHLKSANDILLALIADEAEDLTSEEKAASAKSAEPGDHSKLISQLEELKGVFTWNLSKAN